MINMIVFSTLAVLTAAQSTVDDTPFSNFTQDLIELQGPLVVPPAEIVSDNKSEYEGRWYGVYSGLQQSQVKTLSCLYFDSFFDNQGNFHTFANFKENEETIVVISDKKPIKPEEGIYLNLPETKKSAKSVLYYVDEDVIAYWTGLDAEDKHYQEVVIGFRDTNSVSQKTAQLEKIYSSLVEKGAPSEKHEISYENCKYPEAMQKPYKSE